MSPPAIRGKAYPYFMPLQQLLREDAISPCMIQLASLVAQAMIRSWCLDGAVVIIKIKINAPAGVKMKQLTCKL
ncbi:hypothetical protein NC651_014359 [Populus alba x Populus x berolinensis]|nr:hypothetical protein NC651_014359 [Populus alba x Populus x berolinensis]